MVLCTLEPGHTQCDGKPGSQSGEARFRWPTQNERVGVHLVEDGPVPDAIVGPKDVDLLPEQVAGDVGAPELTVHLQGSVAPQPEPPC